MINSRSTAPLYDNEALGSLVIDGLVKILGSISLAKSILILPLLLHDPIIKRLSTSAKYRSIDEFLVKERINLGDLNLRMQNMLPLSINCFSILLDLGLIKQEGIHLISVSQINEQTNIDIGLRATKILRVLRKSSFLFNESDAVTYLKFNIAL